MTENFEYDVRETPFAVCEADLSDGELEECLRALAPPRKHYVYLSVIVGAALIALFFTREAALISVIALLFSVCLYFAVGYKRATAPHTANLKEYYAVSEGMSLRVEFAAKWYFVSTEKRLDHLSPSFVSDAYETPSCWTLRLKSFGTLIFLPLPKRGFRSAEEYGAFLKEVIDPLPEMKVKRLTDGSGVAAPLFGAGVSGKLYRGGDEGRIPLSVCETQITDAEYGEFFEAVFEAPVRKRLLVLAALSLAPLGIFISYGTPGLIAASAVLSAYSLIRLVYRLATRQKRFSEYMDRSVGHGGRLNTTRFYEDKTEIESESGKTRQTSDIGLLTGAREKKLTWLLYYRVGNIPVAQFVCKSGFRTKEDLESFLSFLSQRLPEQAIKRLKK